MELSEKIRISRLEAGLSQRQLCGGEITRNMLSLIENGAAKPSVKTLRYLANQLGKPLSYFLDEQAEAETELLTSSTALEKAKKALEEGKEIYAAQLLEQVSHPALLREKLLLEAKIPGANWESICTRLPSLDEELLLRAENALELGDLTRCAGLLGAVEDRKPPRYGLLLGKLCFARKDYEGAAAQLLLAEVAWPRAVIPLLEECYRELGDYRRAYAYACKQKG